MGAKVRFAAIHWARGIRTMLHNGRIDRLGHHLVLLMSTYAKNDGTDVYVSVATLAQELHASLQEVEEALQRLEAAGYIERAAASNGALGWSLNLSLVHQCDAVVESRAERRRETDRERKRRQRERQRVAGHSQVDRDVTQESERTTVTVLRDAQSDVTQDCHDVTQDCHACHASGSVTCAGQEGCNSLKNSLNSPISLTGASHDAPHRQDHGTKTETADRLLTAVPDPDKPARKKRRSKLADEYTPEFLAWWSLYPRKADKFPAFQAFERVLSNTKLKASAEILTEGATRYAAEVAGRDQEHIKYGATWLNGRGWEDGAPVPVAEATLTATEWVRAEWKAGRVKPIEERTGLHYTPPDLPLNITGRDAIEQFHANACREWIAANHDQIIERLARRSAS